jgi:P27 family predicted phage terminase small subunit
MKSGPRPIPTQLKLLRGNPGKQRLRDDPLRPEQSLDVPDPPAFITGYAADEWYAVATELHRLGVLTKVDCAPLAAYCYAYGQWRDAAEMLASMANEPARGLVILGTLGKAVENPLIYIARKAAADMMRYAAEFGLTPAARSRITGGNNGDDEQGSKFAGLLAH